MIHTTSDAWLTAVSPSYAVIQSETGNDYGHPHKETIEKLNNAKIQIFRNDTMGEIVMKSDGKNISVTASDGTTYELSKGDTQATNTENTVYIGNVNSKKFHTENCSSLPSESNSVYFDSRNEAVSEGYEPCGRCNP